MCLFPICGVYEIVLVLVRFNSSFSFFRKTVHLPPPYLVWTSEHWETSIPQIFTGRRPQVGLFVSRSIAFRPVLFSLYLLIHHSLIQHQLEMVIVEYREDDVRSSKLETGLSLNAKSLCKVVDIAMSKLPSSSSLPLLHALSKICFLTEKHLNGFRKKFQFSKGTSIRLPRLNEKACSFARGEVCFSEVDFLGGLRFPIHPFIMQLLHNFQIALGQLVPNAWRTIISCISI